MRNKVLLLLGLASLSFGVQAKNIGTFGQVFPVIEEDIRQVIMKRLQHMQQTGEMAHLQKTLDERVALHITRPKPLSLTTTTTPKSFHVDPSITVNHDIYAPNGLLVAKAGMTLNPFDHVHFSKTLIFFNGDDVKQVDWVMAHYQTFKQVKFILTGGDIRDAANRFGRIYFDVDGRLSTKLNIQHVPTVVHQDGRFWQVSEIGVFDA